MPFALLLIGVLLVTAGVRNTQGQLFTLVKGDFTGPGNYIFWMISILVIGAVGYIPKLKPISTGFLVLVVLVLFLKKGDPKGFGGGFFDQFTKALGGTTKQATGAGGSTQTPSLTDVQKRLADLREQLAHTFELEDALK